MTATMGTHPSGATTDLLARLNELSGVGPWPETATAVSFYWEPLLHQQRLAAMTFAGATGAIVERLEGLSRGGGSYFLDEPTPTAATLVPDPELVAAASSSPVLQAVEQIRGWLGVSYEAVAKMAGMGSASLFYYWKRRLADRETVNPRPATVVAILRLHALVRGLVETIEGEPGGLGVQLWVRTKQRGQEPLDLLMEGRLEDAEALTRDLLFGSDAAEVPTWRSGRLERPDPSPVPTSSAPQYEASDFA